MGERRACPWWWRWWWRARRWRRARRRLFSWGLLSRKLFSWHLFARQHVPRRQFSRREGGRRQAGRRRQGVLPASGVLRTRGIRRGGASFRRRPLVRAAFLRVSVSVPVRRPFVWARVCARVYAWIHPARPRAAAVLVLVRRPRGLLPLHPGLPGRLAAGSASAPARILIGQRSSATPSVLSDSATSYPLTRTSATVRPYLSSPRDSTVTGPEASTRCRRSRAPSSRRSSASRPRTR